MSRLCIEKLDPKVQPQPDLPGLRTTITIPNVPANLQTWQDFLNWLHRIPEILPAILSPTLLLLAAPAPPQKP